ncbi:RNA methyltransferase [Corticibacter populi]|uniref:RNA methyltransferase n=1 Tax=Corticibacter populi TaxID=1550736 RepID=A0A3M6R0R4_9BURK|nr:RNA methyltransferase [Corticibacter populi]RMX08479.1 RNA methyltransferase [Corticibacter populi]RZS35792.1 TrmH family RNA methyltransferase [Corticibacter populi]
MSAFSQILHISSRDNTSLKSWRRLAQDSHAYRKQGQMWLEGEHLCGMARQAGWAVATLVVSDAVWQSGQGAHWQVPGAPVVVVPERLFADISALESPAGLAYVLQWPGNPGLLQGVPTVVLDRLQDAGNVGAILRSAAAFGFRQVAAMQGTAGLWSPKVVRAGMGAHFSLHLVEQVGAEEVGSLAVPFLLTSSHDGEYLHQSRLPWPCAWILGHEGQGVGAALQALPHTPVRIAQPGGQESLNVAAAAAICLHASAVAQLPTIQAI